MYELDIRSLRRPKQTVHPPSKRRIRETKVSQNPGAVSDFAPTPMSLTACFTSASSAMSMAKATSVSNAARKDTKDAASVTVMCVENDMRKAMNVTPVAERQFTGQSGARQGASTKLVNYQSRTDWVNSESASPRGFNSSNLRSIQWVSNLEFISMVYGQCAEVNYSHLIPEGNRITFWSAGPVSFEVVLAGSPEKGFKYCCIYQPHFFLPDTKLGENVSIGPSETTSKKNNSLVTV